MLGLGAKVKRFCLFLLACAVGFGQNPGTRVHEFKYAEPMGAVSSAAPQAIADQYLRAAATDLGLSAADVDTVYLAREYKSDHNGVTHLLFRQRFQEIEVRNAAWVINIDRDGRVINAGGTLFAQPDASMKGPDPATAIPAVRAAAVAVN